jgi:DNA-binding winged helix-turn-helix (wHTH) protein/TolB-like protein
MAANRARSVCIEVHPPIEWWLIRQHVMADPSSARVRFGQFEFDPSHGELKRDGVPVRLQPQPARVLTLLVERAGDVVARDELRQRIWGSDTFVDFERGLNFCVAHIRSALGDSADSPRFVETIPRRGYRFIAPVAPIAAPTIAAPGAVAEPVPRPRDSGRKWIAAGVAATVVLGALGLMAGRLWLLRAAHAPVVRVAVMPFDNETGSPEYDQVARGVADATVARLASPELLSRINVVGNAAILRGPRDRRDLKAIGTELGVDYVVLGQVKRDRDRVRLIAHLIRVSDQGHMWAQTFDRADFSLQVQTELANEIARSITARLAAL